MSLLDTIRRNKANAEKATALDNLEKKYVANQVEGLAADRAALIEYMRPLYSQRAAEVLNQVGRTDGRPAEQIPYHQGNYVLPDDSGLASEYFRRHQ